MNMTHNDSYTTRALVTSLKLLVVLGAFLLASIASAASLSLSPATGVYGSNQTFTVRVVVNTSGAAINAADGTIKFSPNELSVVSVAKGSVFNLWTAEPTFSNTAGTINFSGGTPTGYTGSSGAVLNVTFRTKGSGPTKVNFSNGSVLAADGRGTNVLTSMGGGTYTISAATSEPAPEVIIEYVPPANTPAAPTVSSVTHPDASAWYAKKDAELTWNLPAGITAVRTLLDGNASSIPSKVYDSPISSITLSDLGEGVQYFHIQLKNADGWGRVTHYRLAVDTVAPSNLVLSLPDGADLSSPEQIIAVKLDEATSVVKRYLVKLDTNEPFEYIDETGSSTIRLTNLTPGYHTAMIEAFDEAGNSTLGTISFTILSFDKPTFTEYPVQINEDVIPVIKGQTRPNAAVEVTVRRVSDGEAPSEQVYNVTSGTDGIFTVIPEGTFPLGVYELIAVATDEHGAKSEPSDAVRIAVQKPGYIQLGSLAVDFLSVFIPLLALLGVAVIGLWYLIMVIGRMKRSVEREASEAVSILGKEFATLQNELDGHKLALIESRKAKKLTKAEEYVITSLSTSLAAARKRVEKEIEDVENLVD